MSSSQFLPVLLPQEHSVTWRFAPVSTHIVTLLFQLLGCWIYALFLLTCLGYLCLDNLILINILLYFRFMFFPILISLHEPSYVCSRIILVYFPKEILWLWVECSYNVEGVYREFRQLMLPKVISNRLLNIVHQSWLICWFIVIFRLPTFCHWKVDLLPSFLKECCWLPRITMSCNHNGGMDKWCLFPI